MFAGSALLSRQWRKSLAGRMHAVFPRALSPLSHRILSVQRPDSIDPHLLASRSALRNRSLPPKPPHPAPRSRKEIPRTSGNEGRRNSERWIQRIFASARGGVRWFTCIRKRLGEIFSCSLKIPRRRYAKTGSEIKTAIYIYIYMHRKFLHL